MAIYALDFYGRSLYGRPLYVAFEAADMVARQVAHGRLEISWGTPRQSDESQILAGVRGWTRLRLVRSSYGIPDTPEDGWILLDVPAPDGEGGQGDPQNVFLDDQVVPGKTYYYAIFVASTLENYASWRTYQAGDLITDNGISYRCLVDGTVGVTPAGNPTIWEVTDITEPWYPAGGCVGLVVADHGHSQLLYDLVPRPYKVALVETTATSIPVNDQLSRFLSIFGFFFDCMKSEHDRLRLMTDILQCSDRQLALIAQQMGLLDLLPTMAELRRTFMRDAMLIQRDRGTPDAAEALVEAMTGWKADVTLGYNKMLSQETSNFLSPRYEPWNPDQDYNTHISPTQLAPIVTYGDTLYRSIGGSVDYSTYDMSSAITGDGTLVTQIFDTIAHPYRGYAGMENVVVGNRFIVTYNAPGGAAGGAGNYYINLTLVGGPDCGIVTLQSNGVAVPGVSIDTYRDSAQLLPPVTIGPLALNATANTIALVAAGQNPLATDNNAYLCYFNLQKVGLVHNRGQVPPAATSFWQAVAPGTVRNYDASWRPLTDGIAGWNSIWFNGANRIYNPRPNDPGPNDLWWISVRGGATGTLSPGPDNALAVTNAAPAANPTLIDVFHGGTHKNPTWNAGTRYFTDQAVTHNPRNLPTAPVYVATTRSQGLAPDTNPDQWQLTPLMPANPPTAINAQPSVLQSQAIPLTWHPEWNALRIFVKGTVVTWNRNLYQVAVQQVSGIEPSGDTTDNRQWRYLGPDVQRITLSAYHQRSAGTTLIRPWITWYDAYGTALGSSFYASADPIVLDRFEFDGSSYPSSTGYTPPPLPARWQQGIPLPWQRIRGQWTTAHGTVYPTTWDGGGSNDQAGRMLWMNRAHLYAAPTTTNETAYATFISQPDTSDGTQREHGIAFRYGGTATAVNYFLASRTRLTYTQLTVNAGSVTAVNISAPLATWAAIPDGARMRVADNGGVITVSMRAIGANTWTQIASISDTRNNNQLGVGLLERKL